MISHPLFSRLLGSASTLCFFVGIALASFGCSSTRPPVSGKSCNLNSDCDSPLICSSFKLCHEACRADGDCPNGGVCVLSPPASMSGGDGGGLRVCVKDTCARNSDCVVPLICAKDLQCRQECVEDRDCAFPDFRCVVGGLLGEKVCARPQEVSNGLFAGDGGLMSSAGGNAGGAGGRGEGAGGEPGGGGAAGGGAAAVAGAAGGAAAGPGAGGIAGAAGTGGTAGAGGAPLDGGSELDAPVDAPGEGGRGGTGVVDAHPADADTDAPPPEAVPEGEPNDTPETARPLAPGIPIAGTVASNPTVADKDYFEVVTPSGNPAGGYFRGSVTGIGDGNINVYVYSTTDNAMILKSVTLEAGKSAWFYWSARAGIRYVLLVRPYAANDAPAYRYTLSLDYVAIDDPSEPNDTSDTPHPITTGQPVSAYLFAGFDSSVLTGADFADWYQVNLAPGTATLRFDNIPRDVTVLYHLYDSDFREVSGMSGKNAGASFTGTYTVPAPGGLHKLLVTSQSVPSPNYDTLTSPTTPLPDHFTRPYTLTVSQ